MYVEMQHALCYLLAYPYILYYLSFLISCSENTKNVLLSCAFIHMEKNEFIKQFSEISSINQRILLSGPAGTFFSFHNFSVINLIDAIKP
jgi:hypothetical protein